MGKRVELTIVAALLTICAMPAAGQKRAEKPPNPVHLDLTVEIAATTDEGHPSVLRITLKNAGNVAVDMPMPQSPCLPGGGGVAVLSEWHANEPKGLNGAGSGWGCGRGNFPSLFDRVHNEWICLRPGEFITVSEVTLKQFQNQKPGMIEYWVEYTPPEAKPEELAELQRSGYNIPTEKIESDHESFVVR